MSKKQNKERLKLGFFDPLNPVKVGKAIWNVGKHEWKKHEFRKDRNQIIDNPNSTAKEKATATSQLNRLKRGSKTVAEVHAANKAKVKANAERKNKDFQRMKQNKMSKEDFMRKYPNSGTTRRHTARMNPAQKRKFLKSLKEKKPLGTRLANMLDNK